MIKTLSNKSAVARALGQLSLIFHHRARLIALGGMALGLFTFRCPGQEPVIVDRGPHHRVWQRTIQETLPSGKVRTRTTGFTELASGMHRWDAQANQWVESGDTIEIFEGGAIARQGAHQVIFAPNANTAGAVDLLTPDGMRLRSHVLGIAIYEPRTGESEMIAWLKDSLGELYPPNIVVYPDAFDGIRAHLRYTYRIGGFEQDVILTEQISLPEGWDPGSVLIQVWSEFLDGHTPGVVPGTRAGMTDDAISFGAMQTGAGQAFSLGGEEQRISSAPVAKRWAVVEGRTFLVESVHYYMIKRDLDRLPKGQARAEPRPGAGRHPRDFCPFPSHPPTKQARAAQPRETFRTASVRGSKSKGVAATLRPPDNHGPLPDTEELRLPQRGFVIDYDLANSLSNFTFQADTTYVATNTVTLSGTTTFEGGCVVKFAKTNTATLSLGATVVWNTGPYRNAIFTAIDDTTVGDPTIGSGSPTGYYGGSMLNLGPYNGGSPTHLRLSYAATAIAAGNPIVIRHAQFVHCNKGIDQSSGSGTVTNDNVLFYDIGTLRLGLGYFVGNHLTIHKCTNFSAGTGLNGQLLNSLIIGFQNWGPCEPNQTSCYVNSSDEAGVFQTVGAAGHYLASNSAYRNAGSAVSATLSNELRQLTTYPPVVLSSTTNTSGGLLIPQAQRDLDPLDLGYHYDPLDFVLGDYAINNAVLLATNGVVLGTYAPSYSKYALALQNGAQFICEGSPLSPNRFVRYNMVQEQANANWTNAPGPQIQAPLAVTSVRPQARFRFTEWSLAAQDTAHFSGDCATNGGYQFRDCAFYGGRITTLLAGLYFTNCLFYRVNNDFAAYDYAFNVSYQNALFYRGFLYFYDEVGGCLWTLTDSLFDSTIITTNSVMVTNGYNAYTTNVGRLYASTGGDVFLAVSNVTYQTWGANTFYLPTNSALINAGSTWATNVGLYHFTITTNQLKEAATKVDIGYHYVAVTNGAPIDTDGDGVPDYLEDSNGNESVEFGEDSWQAYNSPYRLTGTPALQVFTPLK